MNKMESKKRTNKLLGLLKHMSAEEYRELLIDSGLEVEGYDEIRTISSR